MTDTTYTVAPLIITGFFMLIYAATLVFLIIRIRVKFTKQIKFVLVVLFLASSTQMVGSCLAFLEFKNGSRNLKGP